MSETEFLNVDLSVESTQDLAPLRAALDPAAFALEERLTPAGFRTTFELLVEQEDAELTIRRLVSALSSLPLAARRLWDTATLRQFSIGISAGYQPASLHVSLSAELLAEVASLGGSLEVVVYTCPTS